MQGTDVIINVYSIFNDKNHYGDPENFRPERFISEEGKYIRDERLIFFGSGKRICLGEALAKNMEFIFFVSILQRFNLRIPEGEPEPSFKTTSGFTVSPYPFKVKLTKRI